MIASQSKQYEGNELYCYNCENTWDVDNCDFLQICPNCKSLTEDKDGKPLICHNPFITCDCGARVYFTDNGADIECNGCGSLYYDNDGQITKLEIDYEVEYLDNGFVAYEGGFDTLQGALSSSYIVDKGGYRIHRRYWKTPLNYKWNDIETCEIAWEKEGEISDE